MPELSRCHRKALPGSQQPMLASLWKTQICSSLSDYRTPRGGVTSVRWLAGRPMLAQGPRHATRGFQPGFALRSNRVLRFWRSKARCQDALTALKKQTAVAGCMSTSTGIISGPGLAIQLWCHFPISFKHKEADTFPEKQWKACFSFFTVDDCYRNQFKDQYNYCSRKQSWLKMLVVVWL